MEPKLDFDFFAILCVRKLLEDFSRAVFVLFYVSCGIVAASFVLIMSISLTNKLKKKFFHLIVGTLMMLNGKLST